MNPYSQDYLAAHLTYAKEEIARSRNGNRRARGSPGHLWRRARGAVGRMLVLSGARLFDESAVIGDRVVVLELARPDPCPEEPCLEPAA